MAISKPGRGHDSSRSRGPAKSSKFHRKHLRTRPDPRALDRLSASTPSNYSLSILSSHTSDSSPTFILSFEQTGSKYVFGGIGEGTTRVYASRPAGRELDETKGVFLFGVGSASAGLGSLLMSFADAGPAPRMDIVGPPGLKHFLATMRQYLYSRLSTSFESKSNETNPSPSVILVYRESLALIPTEIPFSEFRPKSASAPGFATEMETTRITTAETMEMETITARTMQQESASAFYCSFDYGYDYNYRKRSLSSSWRTMRRENDELDSNQGEMDTQEDDRDPKPVFKDINIEVYAIPVYPERASFSSPTPTPTSTAPGAAVLANVFSESGPLLSSLKRKRPFLVLDELELGSDRNGEVPPVKKLALRMCGDGEDAAMSESNVETKSKPESDWSNMILPWADVMIDIMFPSSRAARELKANAEAETAARALAREKEALAREEGGTSTGAQEKKKIADIAKAQVKDEDEDGKDREVYTSTLGTVPLTGPVLEVTRTTASSSKEEGTNVRESVEVKAEESTKVTPTSVNSYAKGTNKVGGSIDKGWPSRIPRKEESSFLNPAVSFAESYPMGSRARPEPATPKKQKGGEWKHRDKFAPKDGELAREDIVYLGSWSHLRVYLYLSLLKRLKLEPNTSTSPPFLPSALTLSYLILGPRQRGKFDAAKANELGIPGVLRNVLARGESVRFKRRRRGKGRRDRKARNEAGAGAETKTNTGVDDANDPAKDSGDEYIIIHPSDVLGPPIPRSAVLILNVPSVECVESSSISAGTVFGRIKGIGGFVAGFAEKEDTQHILSSPQHLPDPLTFTSSGYHLLKLNALDPEIFRVPKWRVKAERDFKAEVFIGGERGSPIPLPRNLSLLKPHTLIPLRPAGPPKQDDWAIKGDRFHRHFVDDGPVDSPKNDEAIKAKLKKDSDNIGAVGAEAGAGAINIDIDDVDNKSIEHTENVNDNVEIMNISSILPRLPNSVPSSLTLKSQTAAAFAQGRASVKAFQHQSAMHEVGKEVKGSDVGVITLGTGSAVPGKYRNVSATAITIPTYGNILLDCGEGTWGQLCRFFGTEKMRSSWGASADEYTSTSSASGAGAGTGIENATAHEFLRNLKCIYVSHVHADHHLGVAKVLAERKKLNPPPTHPCYLITIRAVHMYLRELQDLEDLGLVLDPFNVEVNASSSTSGGNKNSIIPVLSPALHWKQSDEYLADGMWSVGGTEEWLDLGRSRAHAQAMCHSLNLKQFLTVDVRHRTRCYGAVIRSEDGWSVVFSADTMPSDSLVYAGQRASVLIHEATMTDEPDQVKMAVQKAHSTIGQAIGIGKRMNTHNILLTHFSARQPRIPRQTIASTTNSTDAEDPCPFIATAFDYANLTIGNMWKMQFYMQAIEESYREVVKEVGDEGDEEEVGEVEGEYTRG
ncbi:hypothetical protein BT96DRAFT_995290 [Gymnopus androsaceus JB14]|uniref:ribonuclease Z n=1 Tax=Gymnopus androsaceus JB14 TaxID=1447944 RepID=A0A6A4HIR1_9AGAR|nr:hypothetical protein BT96DRAFT_995290 [Gymnopus androsaceus JB14]